MKYHDTGGKDPAHALASWFDWVLNEDVRELRMQTGYFRFDAVRAISSSLKRVTEFDFKTYFVIGANDGDTLHSEITRLVSLMGLPRSQGGLAIVSFSNALFHPKVYHIKRADGSQAAFVGSANFTTPGITGGNVEAAFSVDTAEGDPEELLNQVAAAIDKWFEKPTLDGTAFVTSLADADALLEAGVLTEARPPRATTRNSGKAGAAATQPRRQKLVKLPPWPDELEESSDEAKEDEPGESEDAVPAGLPEEAIQEVIPAGMYGEEEPTQPSVKVLGFPDYILFAPGTDAPTSGSAALSGIPLPGGSVGLILKLNKDSGRHFYGKSGTANMSIPTVTVKTFRFGVYGEHSRPRAEINLRLRFYSDEVVVEEDAASNVMGYGFVKGESGHGDVRMLMPAAVKGLVAEIMRQEQRLPEVDDVFLLEWPTAGTDSFGLTFLDPSTSYADKARELYGAAEASGQLVGGACWLPPALAPEW